MNATRGKNSNSILKQYIGRFPKNGSQLWLYLAGLTIFSLGAKCFIDSHLGVDPLDVLSIGMTKHLPITIGISSGIIAITFLLIWTLWNRKWPPIAPFFTTFIVGNLIDVWNLLHLENVTTKLPHYYLLAFGLILCSYSSSLIIMSGVGIRIMDLVAITIVNRWKWQFIYAKMLLEVGMFSIGWILGGPIGIGTLAFLAVVGTLIQPFMWLNNRHFLITNYGLKTT